MSPALPSLFLVFHHSNVGISFSREMLGEDKFNPKDDLVACNTETWALVSLKTTTELVK